MRNKLEQLYKEVDRCKFCRRNKNPLQHIHGVGVERPRLMLVLINPTYRNLSSASGYDGLRFPFIGVRQFWKVLSDGGLISKEVGYNLPTRSQWMDEHTKKVHDEINANKLFLTNVVKCCYDHSNYPEKSVIEEYAELLGREIKIVRPEKIVAFGGLVCQLFTGRPIILSDYWQKPNSLITERLSGLNIPVIPCYFPLGRGKPKEAARILNKFA